MKHLLRILLIVFPLLVWIMYKIIDSRVGISKGESTGLVLATIVGMFSIIYLEQEKYK